uniref:Uncharacterized protein n=1 Tax=Glossina pallidipes TaxID=7398 RepID=A0A1A9ZCG5_GLOPL
MKLFMFLLLGFVIVSAQAFAYDNEDYDDMIDYYEEDENSLEEAEAKVGLHPEKLLVGGKMLIVEETCLKEKLNERTYWLLCAFFILRIEYQVGSKRNGAFERFGGKVLWYEGFGVKSLRNGERVQEKRALGTHMLINE